MVTQAVPFKHLVDIIFDLRQYSNVVDDVGTILTMWKEIESQIVGRPVASGQSLSITLPAGKLGLWIVDPRNSTQINSDTAFQIIDVIRSPKLIYRCIECGEYGPLRCIVCEESGTETRLCSIHAHAIKDELKAYCRQHIPKCECRPNCPEVAIFRCRRCHKLYGNHVHRHHPNDEFVDYCQLCYRILFEHCEVTGCHNLGKSKCAYQTREMASPCQKPLCAEHSYQWKIWGPHNRGVTLCEHHKNLLGETDPSDLLFMMFTAKPPYIRRGKRQSLPNPFRLRRVINRNRSYGLTFDQIGYAIRVIETQVTGWGSKAESNYRYLAKSYFETTNGLSGIETGLLSQVKTFYQQAVGWDAAQRITGLEIMDRFYKPGQPPRYRVRLSLSTSNKGAYIGRGGSIINQLRDQLNIEIDLN